MTKDKDITVEEAQKVLDEHNALLNPEPVRSHTDPESGLIMKAQEPDKSVLTYDPENPEYDEEVRKRAEKARKDADKAKKS